MTDSTQSVVYGVEHHYLRALFLDNQYRRCITACRELLQSREVEEVDQPLRQTSIQFYLALSHDELARAIHNFSHAKIPAFIQAEQLYHDALHSLPTISQCIESLVQSAQEEDPDPFYEQEGSSRYASSTTLGAAEDPRISLSLRSPPAFAHIRHDSPQVISPGSVMSDQDDLESHESFDQIMTPNRVVPKLQRDYSSMSLIQPLQEQPMSQGLMRPIRLGEAPKQYHVPPRLPYSRNTHPQSRLPRLQTRSVVGSPVRKQLRTSSEQASPIGSPVSPVSPLGSEGFISSDASTISPISPETPYPPADFGTPDQAVMPQGSLRALSDHLEGMRTQLDSHMRLLREEKQRVLDVQSERAAARLVPDKAGRLGGSMKTAVTDRSIQKSFSFWTFTPYDALDMQKQWRIQAGRQRGWMRARFDATRYEALAEKALAEL